MTICIAALAENGKKIVLVADQMVTANIPIPYQYETPEVKKIYEITNNSIVLTAGNALFAHEIIENGQVKIKAISGVNTIEEISEVLRAEYQNYRKEFISRTFLEPRGLDLTTYYSFQQKLSPILVQEIDNAFENFNIAVEMIVVGYNPDGGRIYSITHPGLLISHDPLGYACIGTGAPHAIYYLMGSNYKKSLSKDEVTKLILEAKKKSEAAPGVGKEITLLYLPKDGEKDDEFKK